MTQQLARAHKLLKESAAKQLAAVDLEGEEEDWYVPLNSGGAAATTRNRQLHAFM